MLDLRSSANNWHLSLHRDEMELFKSDVLAGLSKPNKQIPSKYFYDERGSALFDKITTHPDYYLTRAELVILNTYKKHLAKLFAGRKFNLIELGPGEGKKSRILIDQFTQAGLDFSYSPVDISETYLDALIPKIHAHTPDLQITPICGDYFDAKKWLRVNPEERNIVLFLGSNIGNFDSATTEEFLRNLWQGLNEDDFVLIGFDLRKDIDVLMRAYNDSDGITHDFNLNLLQRMNRELGANFNIKKFEHYATYNVHKGVMESYIVSREAQIVEIKSLEKSFAFQSSEAILVECSCKYRLPQIDQMARTAGFEVMQTFTDPRHYFVDSLWRVKKP